MKLMIIIWLMSLITVMYSSQITSGEDAKSKPVSSPPLKLSISSEKKEVIIGDWISIDLTLSNMTQEKIEALKPVLDIDSVSFAIRINPTLTKEKSWSFVHSIITPSVYEHNRSNLEKVTLDKCGTITSEFKARFNIPAVYIASWEIMAYYQGNQGLLSTEPLQFQISAPKSEKSKEIKDGDLIANMETTKGTMKCRFFFRDAPNTVINFIKLSKDGFYNNLKFHRIIKGFMIQGGCPKGTGGGSPGYSVKAEFNSNKHLRGTLSMARSPHNDSAGSQFFVCHSIADRLDNKYTTFGEVVEGLDILDAIANVQVAPNPNTAEMSQPMENVTIKTISLEFKETVKKE